MEYHTISPIVVPDNDAIHDYFGLTYANFLVLPRVALQSMPDEWQKKFVELLNDIPEVLPEVSHIEPDKYTVSCRSFNGRYVRNPWPHYNRGRTRMYSILNTAGNSL